MTAIKILLGINYTVKANATPLRFHPTSFVSGRQSLNNSSSLRSLLVSTSQQQNLCRNPNDRNGVHTADGLGDICQHVGQLLQRLSGQNSRVALCIIYQSRARGTASTISSSLPQTRAV